jgi:poly-gamma-glutamate synthesis protein (capsule biosynthesis protein)
VKRWLLAVPLLFAGGWALFETLRNPQVPLADPRVLTRTPRESDDITIVLGGDFAPTDAAMPFIRAYGWQYPYRATAPLFADADIAFANLEAPVTTSTKRFPLYKDYIYRVEPAATEAWQWLGLDVVSVANNHSCDYRDQGFLDTLANLSAAGIEPLGGGRNESEARRPVIFDVGGTRVGFLAYLEHKAVFNLYLRQFAVGNRVGVAQLNRADVTEDVRRLRPLVDVLIVSVHWGANYSGITRTQEEYAQLFAELGVDVVAGHHPHVAQAAEVRNGCLILYSLGNYAWGAFGEPELTIGLLARLHVRPHGKVTSAELFPIVTQNRVVMYQPCAITPAERPWLDPFLKSSRSRGTKLDYDGTTVRWRR